MPKENIVPHNEGGKPLAEIQRLPEGGTELAAEMPLSENVSLQNMMMPLQERRPVNNESSMLLVNAVKPLPQESSEHLLNALIANDDKTHLINTQQAESDPVLQQVQFESNIDRETADIVKN